MGFYLNKVKGILSVVKMADSFVGRFVVESKDNYDGFMKGVGIPDEFINQGRDVKVVTDISKDGDAFVVQRIRPTKTVVNRIILGQECEIENIKGEKVKVKCTFEGGKMIAKGSTYSVVMEMVDGKLKETITFRPHHEPCLKEDVILLVI